MQPSAGSVTTRYLHRDHLGSVTTLTDENSTIIESMSYDAYGRRRDATDWDGIATAIEARGYTGHEHLDNVGLIHMNGRVYDPALGRMLSADPFVPNPLNGQSWNRYTYVLNNPLGYTDPSGFNPDDELPEITVTGGRIGHRYVDADDFFSYRYRSSGAWTGLQSQWDMQNIALATQAYQFNLLVNNLEDALIGSLTQSEANTKDNSAMEELIVCGNCGGVTISSSNGWDIYGLMLLGASEALSDTNLRVGMITQPSALPFNYTAHNWELTINDPSGKGFTLIAMKSIGQKITIVTALSEIRELKSDGFTKTAYDILIPISATFYPELTIPALIYGIHNSSPNGINQLINDMLVPVYREMAPYTPNPNTVHNDFLNFFSLPNICSDQYDKCN